MLLFLSKAASRKFQRTIRSSRLQETQCFCYDYHTFFFLFSHKSRVVTLLSIIVNSHLLIPPAAKGSVSFLFPHLLSWNREPPYTSAFLHPHMLLCSPWRLLERRAWLLQKDCSNPFLLKSSSHHPKNCWNNLSCHHSCDQLPVWEDSLKFVAKLH